MEDNGSVAVLVPPDKYVIMSVFVEGTDRDSTLPVLRKHYNDIKKATQLVINGDFTSVKPTRKGCEYFMDLGDDILDCTPEMFPTLEAYLRVAGTFGYINNYLFMRDRWLYLDKTLLEKLLKQ